MSKFNRDKDETDSKKTGYSGEDNDTFPSLKNGFESIGLIDIIDVKAIQSMMDDFHHLTKIGVAILDLKGNVLVATGWQAICTQFHRKHPETLKNCIESDLELSAGIAPGVFKAYRCKNNMWDIATPIVVGGNHMGNLYLGQFFYDDEVIDFDGFRSQAKKYDFNETAYLAALDRVPRWSKETVHTVMRFYTRFTALMSKLSYSNLKLVHELEAHESTITLLKKSEGQLRAIFKASPLAMVLLDRDGRVLESNEVHANRINMIRDDLLGRQIWEFLPEEVSAQRKKRVQGVFETGQPFSGEDQREENCIQYHIHPAILDETGNVEAVIVEAVDITDLKMSEIRVVEALSWYREIFEGSKDAIFISDENARLISVNKAACELTGYEPEELTAMRIPDLHDEMDMGAFNAFHARIMRGEPIDSEAKILRKDGLKVEAEFNNKRITVSGKHYMHTTARDISDRKLAETALRASEKALRESEEKYRILFEHTSDALFVAQGGRIVFQNPRSLELTGYSAEEFQSKPFVDFIHEHDRDMVKNRHFSRLRGEKTPERYSFRIIHKNGNVLWAELNAILIQWNEKAATLCFMTDITERKQAEDDLRMAHEKMLTILDSIDSTVYVADMKTYEILFMNKKMITDFGGDKTGGICFKEFRNNTEVCHVCTNKRLIDETGRPAGVCTWHDQNPVTGRYYIN